MLNVEWGWRRLSMWDVAKFKDLEGLVNVD